ncbi:hypothetical protein BH09DEP1_BH09DEP1_6650 [soil metagenome]
MIRVILTAPTKLRGITIIYLKQIILCLIFCVTFASAAMEQQKDNPCIICFKRCPLDTLSKHYNLIHNVFYRALFVCEYCDYVGTQKDILHHQHKSHDLANNPAHYQKVIMPHVPKYYFDNLSTADMADYSQRLYTLLEESTLSWGSPT